MSVQPLLRLTSGQSRVVGSGHIYQLDNDKNVLKVFKITGSRAMYNRETAPEDWPYTFIEQCNLHDIPGYCRGVAVAVHASPESAHLGVAVSLDSRGGTLHYYRWTGATITRTTPTGSIHFTPAYCYLPEKTGWLKNGYSDHFTLKMVNVKNTEIHFLNQVSGRRVEDKPLTEKLINDVDGCFQCSTRRPDFLLPFSPSLGDMYPLPLTVEKCHIYKEEAATVPVKSTKNRRGAGNRKRRKSFAPFAYPSKSSFDTQHSETVYVKNNVHIREGTMVSNQGANSKLQLFAVPYIRKEGCFGLLPKERLKTLFSLSGQSIDDHDQTIELFQVHCVSLQCVDLRLCKKRVRFCLLEPAVYNEVKLVEEHMDSHLLPGTRGYSLPTSNIFHGKMRTGGNEYLPGPVISQWFTWPFQSAVDIEAADVISSTYGLGYGSRGCTQSIGQNFYQGIRQSQRPHANPIRGPGQADKTQYSRQQNIQCFQPACERFANSLANSASNFCQMLDRIVYRFLMEYNDNHNVLGICRRKIITQGIRGKCFSFANACHVDRFDAVQKDVEACALKRLEEYADTTHRRNKLCYDYLKRWVSVLGHIGRPTTCGYVFVGDFDDTVHMGKDYEVVQHFCMDGLGFAVRFGSDISHLFYGSAFSHQTAVTLVIIDGKVLYHSTGSFRVFAWGGN